MPQRKEIPTIGHFKCWSEGVELPELLVSICSPGRTGELRFEGAEGEKIIVINDGNIVFAKSSSEDDRLGPYLIRARKIRFEHMIDLSKFVTAEKRFGTVLVENGVVEPQELVQGVVGQVRSIVLSLFQWPEAMYAFEPKELEKETITLHIPLARLVVDGVRQVSSDHFPSQQSVRSPNRSLSGSQVSTYQFPSQQPIRLPNSSPSVPQVSSPSRGIEPSVWSVIKKN